MTLLRTGESVYGLAMIGRFPILYIAEADPEAAVMSSGVLAHLVQALPHATFVVVGSPDSAALFADTPRLTRLLVLEREGHLEWLGLWNKVRDTAWGLVVDMRGTTLSGRLKRQKRAVRGEVEPGMHAVESAARVMQLDDVPAPKLFFGEATQAAADALIGDSAGPILAIGPGVDWMGKRWPAERYAKVAAPLLAEDGPLAGGRLMIVGDAIDRDAAHTIRFAVPRHRVIELQGKLSRLETAAALSRASLYVGADSIWTQLAVAAAVPSVAVFGPSDEVQRGPWDGVTVRGPRSVDEYRKIDPNLNQAIEHMNDLPADRVLKAARKLLADKTAAGLAVKA